MPGLRSPKVLERRRVRALERGFIKSKVAGKLSVPGQREISNDMKQGIHAELSLVRVQDNGCDATSSGDDTDILFVLDPWANAATHVIAACDSNLTAAQGQWDCYRPPVPPPCTDLNPTAAEFLPFPIPQSSSGALPAMPTSGDPHCVDQIPSTCAAGSGLNSCCFRDARDDLIDAQNHTIELLVSHFESIFGDVYHKGPFSGASTVGVTCDSKKVNDRLQSVETNLRQLAASLAETVQKSVEKRMAEFKNQLDIATQCCDAKVALINEGFNDKLTLVMESVVERGDQQLQNLREKIVADASNIIKWVHNDCHTKINDLQKQLGAPSVLFSASLLSPATSSGDIIDNVSIECRLAECSDDSEHLSGKMLSPSCEDLAEMATFKNERLTCADFLVMAEQAKKNIPHIVEPPADLPMLCDGFHDPGSDAESVDNCVDSELSSNSPNIERDPASSVEFAM